MASGYVFLTECSDFSEAQVIKSFLISRHFHPQIRDEQTRSVAPHLGGFLGRLVIDIPEHEFLEASFALEKFQDTQLRVVTEDETPASQQLQRTQDLSKKCLINSIIGCILVPILCNFYSLILAYRVLTNEKPLTDLSRRRLMWSVFFNAMGFYIWLIFGARFLHSYLQSLS